MARPAVKKPSPIKTGRITRARKTAPAGMQFLLAVKFGREILTLSVSLTNVEAAKSAVSLDAARPVDGEPPAWAEVSYYLI